MHAPGAQGCAHIPSVSRVGLPLQGDAPGEGREAAQAWASMQEQQAGLVRQLTAQVSLLMMESSSASSISLSEETVSGAISEMMTRTLKPRRATVDSDMQTLSDDWEAEGLQAQAGRDASMQTQAWEGSAAVLGPHSGRTTAAGRQDGAHARLEDWRVGHARAAFLQPEQQADGVAQADLRSTPRHQARTT